MQYSITTRIGTDLKPLYKIDLVRCSLDAKNNATLMQSRGKPTAVKLWRAIVGPEAERRYADKVEEVAC